MNGQTRNRERVSEVMIGDLIKRLGGEGLHGFAEEVQILLENWERLTTENSRLRSRGIEDMHFEIERLTAELALEQEDSERERAAKNKQWERAETLTAEVRNAFFAGAGYFAGWRSEDWAEPEEWEAKSFQKAFDKWLSVSGSQNPFAPGKSAAERADDSRQPKDIGNCSPTEGGLFHVDKDQTEDN